MKDQCIFTLASDTCVLGEPQSCGQNGTYYQYYGGVGKCGANNRFYKSDFKPRDLRTNPEVPEAPENSANNWAENWLENWKNTNASRGVFSGKIWLFKDFGLLDDITH